MAGKKNHFTILYYNCDGPRGWLVRRITLLYFTITVTGHGRGAGKKNHFTIIVMGHGGVAGKKNHFTILYYNCDGPREGGW